MNAQQRSERHRARARGRRGATSQVLKLTLTSKIVLGVGTRPVLGSAAAYVPQHARPAALRRSQNIRGQVPRREHAGARSRDLPGASDTTTASPRERRRYSVRRASLIAGTALYVTDEDADTTRRYYRDSATPGAIVRRGWPCHDWCRSPSCGTANAAIHRSPSRTAAVSTQGRCTCSCQVIAASGEAPARRLLGTF